ncbi:hypothetical protein ABT010_13380 [Streptomyces sp. NPDC002668]|uniref:hypothetical protein n=1 Tax=Streptomyces sp. NPDC002668 TaxID=3154422 RepID=UPI00331A4223
MTWNPDDKPPRDARDGDSRRPQPEGRPYQGTAPGDFHHRGRRPDPTPRVGEDTRMHRRPRVTAS